LKGVDVIIAYIRKKSKLVGVFGFRTISVFGFLSALGGCEDQGDAFLQQCVGMRKASLREN